MSWLDRLQPGSFRGVPFHIEAHEEQGGRRVDLQEYAQRDTPSTEDLGRSADLYRLQAFVIADLTTQDYIDNRDQLRAACRQPGPGTLVHPYLGTATVNCRRISMRETIRDGGMAVFDLEFVESGLSPSPTVSQDTQASALSGLGSLLSLAVQAYAVGALVAERPGVLLGLATGYLGGLAAQFLGIPPSILSQVAGVIGNIAGSLAAGATQVTSSVTGLTGDPVAIAVTDAFSAAVNAVTATAAPPATDDVTGVTATIVPPPTDPTNGLLPFTTWGSTLPTPNGLQVPMQLELQQMMTGLVQGAATIAIAQIFAATDWPSSNAAAAAKTTLLNLIDTQILAAAAADQDALYQGWLGLAGLSTADLVQRAQSLPTLATYSVAASLPSAKLAQMFLQDGTQWDSLAVLNSAPHPGFMPASGVYLPA